MTIYGFLHFISGKKLKKFKLFINNKFFKKNLILLKTDFHISNIFCQLVMNLRSGTLFVNSTIMLVSLQIEPNIYGR